jgi:hypothetical protein
LSCFDKSLLWSPWLLSVLVLIICLCLVVFCLCLVVPALLNSSSYLCLSLVGIDLACVFGVVFCLTVPFLSLSGLRPIFLRVGLVLFLVSDFSLRYLVFAFGFVLLVLSQVLAGYTVYGIRKRTMPRCVIYTITYIYCYINLKFYRSFISNPNPKSLTLNP